MRKCESIINKLVSIDMKKMFVLGLGLCLTGLLVHAADPAPAPAPVAPAPGQPASPASPAPRKSKLLEQYDKNGDGKLDETEREAMRKDREAKRKEREAELIKKYDKNGDGKLDEAERQAMRDEYRKKRDAAIEKQAPNAPKKEELKKEEPKKQEAK